MKPNNKLVMMMEKIHNMKIQCVYLIYQVVLVVITLFHYLIKINIFQHCGKNINRFLVKVLVKDLLIITNIILNNISIKVIKCIYHLRAIVS